MTAMRRTVLIGLIAVAFPSLAIAEIRLENTNPLSSKDAIEISMTAASRAINPDTLAVEVNGIDVTSLVSVEQTPSTTQLIVRTATPPKGPGVEIRLVEYSVSGDIRELGIWTLLIEEESAVAGFDFSSSGHITAGYRLRQSGETSFDLNPRMFDDAERSLRADDKQGLQGAAELAFRGTRGQSELRGQADFYLHDDRKVISEITGREIEHDLDLGEYLFSSSHENLSAMVGHHALSDEGLLIQDFHRRGASFTASPGNSKARATAFAFRTEPVTGWRHGLGVSDRSSRVVGGTATVRPLSSNTERLALSATYIKGEGSDTLGTGIIGDASSVSGQGVSLALSSKLFSGKLLVEGEAARTEYDFDGSGLLFEPERDDGRRVSIAVEPFASPDREINDPRWILGAEYQEVGLFFRSLGNPGLPSDKRIERYFSDISFADWTVSLQFAEESDNVAESRSRSVVTNQFSEVSANYAPRAETDDRGDLRLPWYGLPNIYTAFQLSRVRSDFASQNDPLEAYDSPGYFIDASFSHTDWAWRIGHSVFRDRNTQTDNLDTESHSSGAGLTLIGLDRFDLDLQLFRDVSRLDGRRDLEVFGAGANLGWQVVPDVFNVRADYFMNRERDGTDQQRTRESQWGLEMNWYVTRATDWHSGLMLWLRLERRQSEFDAAEPGTRASRRALIGLSFNWDRKSRAGYRSY